MSALNVEEYAALHFSNHEFAESSQRSDAGKDFVSRYVERTTIVSMLSPKTTVPRQQRKLEQPLFIEVALEIFSTWEGATSPLRDCGTRVFALPTLQWLLAFALHR